MPILPNMHNSNLVLRPDLTPEPLPVPLPRSPSPSPPRSPSPSRPLRLQPQPPPPPPPSPPRSPPLQFWLQKPLPPPDSPWIISILEKIEQARQYEASSPWKSLSIYRVPKSLRAVDQTAYTPKIVSIGPYHLENPMNHHKWRFVLHALGRTHQDIRFYLDAVRSLEDRARSCYEAPISLPSDDFVLSLVVDSIFCLELFLGVAKGFQNLGYPLNDPIFTNGALMLELQRDMIMLENQLPFFVVDYILKLMLPREYSPPYLACLALRFFKPLMPTDEQLIRAKIDQDATAEYRTALHFLDLFRSRLLPSARPDAAAYPSPSCIGSQLPIAEMLPPKLIHCVADLRNAGIKFCSRKSGRFCDIEFKDGVMSIPRLLIAGHTKSLLLNLIAFEQCHRDCGNHITSYGIFMDNLINSKEDVGHLHDMEIIEHYFGNDGDVADMFNRLCQGVVFDRVEFYLWKLSEDVNRYYKNKWNTWRASFIHKYFSNPWAFISLIAAVVLLLLTAAQTFYTAYPYYKPK